MDGATLFLLRKRIFTRAALATFGTFILNSIGVWLSIYSIIWWYDMPMHFFGGLFTALLIISFFLRYRWFADFSYRKTAIFVLSLVFLIGIVWEGYEFIFAIIGGQKHLILDSFSDLFFDLAGGVQALFVYFRHRKMLGN